MGESRTVMKAQFTLESWYALRLRSNFEKTAAQHLVSQGYSVFLPTYRCIRRRHGRVIESQLPFFPGYLFCHMDLNRRLPVLMTPGVMSIVGFGKTPIAIPDREIASVRAVVQSDLVAQPWPFLNVGDRIAVERGPLTGTEGILTCTKGDLSLVVTISLLQRSLAVTLDREWVRPVEHSFRPVPAVHSAA
jgi:transcription antitermination factor NusG